MNRSELERSLEGLHAQSWGWALACCGRDRELAEEALQSAYLRILSGAARFDDRSAFRSWVFGVIRRTAWEEMRWRRLLRTREPTDDEATDLAIDPAPGADAAAEQAQLRETLVAALAALSVRQREVLELVFYHDMTVEEAAGVMAVSVGSARTHYARGKQALAATLAALRDRPAMREGAR